MATLLPLSNEEKSRLQKLNNDKSIILSLKKLFLNICTSDPASNEAIKKITQAFHELEVIKPATQTGREDINLV